MYSLGIQLSQDQGGFTRDDHMYTSRVERDEETFNPYLDDETREFELIGTTSEASFIDNTVFNGTQYCYYIVASNVSGDSGASDQACATPEGPPPLYPPEDLVASGQIGSIELSWTEPEDSGGDDGGTDGGGDDGTDGGGNNCDDGYVEDCSGDGDCCPESWIADGFEDCEDQAFGCDLTCYDNDGGDCDGSGTTGGTTGGGTSDCESCDYDWTDYGSECCDTAWDEYGIDCATLEGIYYWDCSGCECPGDNGGGTTGGGGSGSCVGNCGGSSDTCWCDDLCEDYGDCCDDYYDECRGGELGENYDNPIEERPTYSLTADLRVPYIPFNQVRDLEGYNI
jgi:hypothetical protein